MKILNTAEQIRKRIYEVESLIKDVIAVKEQLISKIDSKWFGNAKANKAIDIQLEILDKSIAAHYDFIDELKDLLNKPI